MGKKPVTKVPKGYKAESPTFKIVQETHFYKPMKGSSMPKKTKASKLKPMEVRVINPGAFKGGRKGK